MYHFTFIDEASTTTEQDGSIAQDNASEKAIKQSEDKKNILTKTTNFLYRHFDQPKCFRIFISDN